MKGETMNTELYRIIEAPDTATVLKALGSPGTTVLFKMVHQDSSTPELWVRMTISRFDWASPRKIAYVEGEWTIPGKSVSALHMSDDRYQAWAAQEKKRTEKLRQKEQEKKPILPEDATPLPCPTVAFTRYTLRFTFSPEHRTGPVRKVNGPAGEHTEIEMTEIEGHIPLEHAKHFVLPSHS